MKEELLPIWSFSKNSSGFSLVALFLICNSRRSQVPMPSASRLWAYPTERLSGIPQACNLHSFYISRQAAQGGPIQHFLLIFEDNRLIIHFLNVSDYIRALYSSRIHNMDSANRKNGDAHRDSLVGLREIIASWIVGRPDVWPAPG